MMIATLKPKKITILTLRKMKVKSYITEVHMLITKIKRALNTIYKGSIDLLCNCYVSIDDIYGNKA